MRFLAPRWWALASLVALVVAPTSAETVPLAQVAVDARVEVVDVRATVDWQHLGHRAAGWEYESDTGVAWGLGSESRVELQRLPDRATLVLTGRPFIHPGSWVQEVEVALDGEIVGRLRMAPWRRSYRLRIPDHLLGESAAMLALRYRWSAQPSEALETSSDQRLLAVAWTSIEVRARGESAPTRLVVEGDDVVVRGSGRVRIPLRATAPLAVLKGAVTTRGTASLRLTLDAVNAPAIEARWQARTSSALEWNPASGDRTARHLRLTLQAERRGWLRRLLGLGRALEVRLSGTTIEADNISWPSRDLARMGFFRSADDDRSPPQLVILWVVDTLRADHLGLYDYGRETSPGLDAFAAEAVTFDRAVAQSAWTRPSVTSILTGQLLKRHGVYGKGDALAREATTLAEVLTRGGYGTAAFITNGNLRHVGLEQGFRTFRHAKEGRIREFHHPAQRVLAEAVDWLDRHPDEPAFLYLHVSDPHMPYIPTADFADLWPVPDPEVGTIEGYRATIRSEEPATQDLIDLYDAEIRQADAAFGSLITELRQRDLYDRSMIVFAADHGEEFLDHGAWQHGNSLFSEQIAVPLVIRWPRGASPYPAGSRQQVVAAHADLAPTILQTVGAEVPASMQGHDLADAASRPTFVELRATYRATLDERYKLITDPGGTLLGLYDAVTDPHDHVDLTFSQPAVLEYHRRLQALFLERSGGGHDAASAEQDEETLEQLRALGYLD